jgi:hypothetical protein
MYYLGSYLTPWILPFASVLWIGLWLRIHPRSLTPIRIVLIPKNNPSQTLWNSLDLFTDDFMETREQPPLLESSSAKDWLSEEENKAWKDLN